ncbi:hypothetical protein ACP275_02G015800 [Erythranthe tilingii]
MEASIPPKRRRKGGYAEPCSEPVPIKKKRKERSTDCAEQVREDKKVTRMHQSGIESELEESSSWKSLQLILSLQDKNIDLIKKVDVAFDYVESNSIEEMDGTSQTLQVISTSRTIVFLNDWVQSILISSEKKTKLDEKKPEFGASGSVLDLKCWKIFHFCLEKSKTFHLPLICYKDLLRVIHSITMDASSNLNNMSLCCEGTSVERLELYEVALDCISLVFSSHGGVANQNLDLWILLMDKVLELVLEVFKMQLEGSKLGYFVLQLSSCLFEPFAKFLRLHPTRKNNFHNFIDKLLVPLLHSSHVLHSSSWGSSIEWTNLSKLIEEVLAQGLFHPTHIDGFLNLQSSNRYRNSSDATATVKEEKIAIKSYHRHLFDKVEKMIAGKNGLALIGLAELLHLFVSSVTKHKGVLVDGGDSKQSEVASKKISVSHSMEAELRKSILDYFVQILEYLLEYLNKYLQSDGEAVSLFNVSSTIRSINNLLASFINDKLYLRTEDTSEGAAMNFLKLIYDTLVSISSKISHKKASSCGSDEKSQKELYISVRKDLIVTVHHLLDIEYEVVGDDLESLWAMIFSSTACCYSSMDVKGQPLLFSEILRLGCKLIDLYSELRQVDSSISSLCRALRHSSSLVGDSEAYTQFASYSNALSMLLCSSKFRLSLGNAIKAIPEGQASGCIKQLSSDIMESLDWIKCGHQLKTEQSNKCDSLQFRLRAELMGKVLSEVYIIILDSITVTSGNSYLLGVSLTNLLEIIRPGLSNLVSSQEICVLVDGVTLSKTTGCDNVSICWILVVFFRLILSYRSLFRQTIRLVAPRESEKMSLVMSDSLTIRPASDWLEMAGSFGEDLFSSIIQPPATVLDVIHSVLDICTQDSVVLCPPLVWVLNAVALQRLVELNLLIRSSEYKLQWKDADDSSCRKREKRVTRMRNEAVGLTKFMMESLSSIYKDQIFAPSFGGGIDKSFSVGSLEEKSLAYALWWTNCQHVDIWCSHAAKKDLKKFLTLVIQAFISYINEDNCHSTTHKPMHLEKVTAYQIALEFLNNTISYEQRFVCRYMASSFCKILQMSVSSIFATSGVDLSESPDWIKVISEVEKLSDVQIGGFPSRKPDMVPAENCNEQINVELAKCQRLLTLLVQMPEEYLSLESSSLYITYILNLERLLVSSLLEWRSESCSHNPYQIFRLLVTCRKVLPTLALASGKVNVTGSSKCSLPLPWLLKSLSAVIGVQNSFPEDNAFEAKVAIFSMLHYTSYAWLLASKDQFHHEIGSILSDRKLRRKRKNLKPGTVEPDISECNLQSVLQLTDALDENMHKSLTTFKDEFLHKGCQDLNKLSSTIACFQGLLWGLASTLDNKSFRMKLSNNTEMMTRINSSVLSCMNFTSFLIKASFLEDQPSGKMVSSDTKGVLIKCNLEEQSCPAISDLEAFLSEVQHQKLCLKKSLLMQIFRGENAEASFFLGQLFIACSAVVRLNIQIDLTSIPWSLFAIVVDIAQFLLLEFSRSEEMPHQFAFFWLDGAVKFLEELGSYFPRFDPSLSRDFYSKMIGLHLKVIGKCISLQKKEAKLDNQGKSCISLETSRLDEFKERLRMSFRKYMEKKSSELHLLSVIVAVERALVGEQEGVMANYEIVCGSSNGGEVSSFVAGGIDCLDSILELLLTGSKHLEGTIKEHIQNLVACLFNVILHLQGPTIFYDNVESIKAYERPNSGSVVLMCVEILTKISRNPFFFKKGACHMVQCLRVPGALFQYLLQLQIVNISSDIGTSKCAFDRKFSVELYAISCRMLCTAIKNHGSETRDCIALLEDSVSVLLHCLETVNVHHVDGRESFAWEVQEAVKCASCLRRVYEEVRQQKDFFKEHSFKFLSRYIWVYCGFGPAGNGLIREVDEALKPGVYALLDMCSADNELQNLHTVFGEGPCRSTLAALRNDYENNFQYTGKV